MAALALMTAACSNDDNDLTTPQPQKAEGITITAQLAPKTNGATTRAVSDGGNKILADWAVNEHLAVLYEVGGTKKVADAEITAVDYDDLSATITFTVEDGTPDNTPCTLVYPLSAAKDDHTGLKDVDALLGAQDGTLNANLDVRVGAGTIQTSTPGLTVTTQPEAQFAIFKFTTKNSDGSATIDVNPLTITIGSQDYVITPASATSELYAALPAISSEAVTFTATGSDSKTYTASKASVTFAAGKYYQSNIKLTEQAPAAKAAAEATAEDKGKLIGTDGNIYADVAAATAAGTTAVAKICYVGSDNGEAAPYNHGLALALSDANSGSTCKWKTSNDEAGHSKQTSSTFTEESGLQYNDATHNSDTYPAFKAAKDNNSTAAPTGCSAWFLASGYQWNKMITAAGGYAALRDGFSGITGASNLKSNGLYWSSTEYNSSKAWYLRFINGNWQNGQKHTTLCYVRACLAF